MKYKLTSITLLITGLLVITSCTKDKIQIQDNQVLTSEMVQDEIMLDDYLEDLFFEVDDSDWWIWDLKSAGEDLGCRTVTIEPEGRDEWPKTITIDFGDGCEVKEGLVKKGKIIVEVSAARGSDEIHKKVRFARYQVNGKAFTGGKTLSYMAEGRGGNPTWHTQSRIKIQLDTESSIQKTAVRTRIQARGFDTPRRPMDDVFIINGSSSGMNRAGQSYQTEIVESLVSSRNCRWIRKGVISLQRGEEPEAILDYGDGSCDNLATLTKDGVTKEITLRRK